jgi:type I restriction enzyme S subunit
VTSVALREIVSVRGGGTPRKSVPAYYGGGIPWVTPKDMKRPVIGTSQITLTTDGVKDSPAKIVPEGSVLVVVRSGVLKHTLPVALTNRPVTLNQDMKALVTTERVDASYLARLIKSLQPKVLGWVRATTADNFPIEKLLDLIVELPTPGEQRRIAAILDQADALRAKRRLVLAHLDSLTQSIFHAMFGDCATNRVPIAEFAEVRTGSTPSRDNADNYGGSVPWVKTGEVYGTIVRTSEHVTERGIVNARLRLFPVGSVVVAMYGQGNTRGRSAILGVEATTNQACAVITPNKSFDSVFLQAQLSLAYDRLRGAAEGGNQPNLSVGRVQQFEVNLPPLETQREFSALVAQISRRSSIIERALEVHEHLFCSLQSRAFAGEL